MIQLDAMDCVGVLTIWQKMNDIDMDLKIGRLISYAAKFGADDMVAFIDFCELNGRGFDFIKGTVFHDLRDMNESNFIPRTRGYASAA